MVAEATKLETGLRRWDFRIVPVERGLEAMGDLPGLHIISRSKGVDQFPLTSAVEKKAKIGSKCPWSNSHLHTDNI